MRAHILVALPCLVWCGTPQDALVSDDVCANDGGDCALNELQVNRKESLSASPSDRNTSRWHSGMSFPGGGWKAQTQHAALIAGMIAVNARVNGPDAGNLKSLFTEMDSFISVSGGGWFFSSLAYSPYYRQTVEMCAQTPSQAFEAYNDRWVKKLQDFANSGPNDREMSLIGTNTTESLKARYFEVMREAESAGAQKPFAPPKSFILNTLTGLASQFKEIFSVANAGNFDWYTYTGSMLLKTAGIDADMMVGKEPNEFAKGKLWMPGISIPTPGNGKFRDFQVIPFETGINQIGMKARSDIAQFKDLPMYVPGKYSVVMGTGVGAQSQFPFCANVNCFGIYLEYESQGPFPIYHRKQRSPLLGEDFRRQFGSDVGTLLLRNVVATSSAAMSMLTMIPGLWGLGTTVAAYTAKSVHPYMQASIMLGRARERGNTFIWRTVREFADYGMIPIMDGVLTDNTGIVNGVASGLTVLTTDLVMEANTMLAMSSNYDALPKSAKVPAPAIVGSKFPILEIEATDMLAAYNNFNKFKLADGLLCVKDISYGTIHTKTIHNPWLGLQAGTPLTINMVSQDTKASIVGTSAWIIYGHCVEEFIQTMLSDVNKEYAEDMLDRFFIHVKSHADAAPVGPAHVNAATG